MTDYHFVCVKWGQRYKPEYVNKLYSMTKRQCTLPFQFHCLTDCTEGLDPHIHCLPIPETDASMTGWWHKISIFKPDFYGLKGTLLFCDLDMVILENIDDFFQYKPGEFIVTKGFAKHPLSSCLMRLDIGSQPNIWTDFAHQKDYVMEKFAKGGDQYWVLEVAKNYSFWPKDWVISYKTKCHYHLLPFDLGFSQDTLHRFSKLFKLEAKRPENGKILAFQCKPDIHEILEKPIGKYRAAPWLKDLWA